MKLFFVIFFLVATVSFSAQQTPLESDLKAAGRLLDQIQKQSKDKIFKEQIKVAKRELQTLTDSVHKGLTRNVIPPVVQLQKRLRGYPQQDKLQNTLNYLSKIISAQGAFTMTGHREFGVQIMELSAPEGVFYFQIPDDIREGEPYTFGLSTIAAGPSDLQRNENAKLMSAYKILIGTMLIQPGPFSKQVQVPSAVAATAIVLKTPEDFEVLKSKIETTKQNQKPELPSQAVQTSSELEVDTQPPAEPVMDIDIPHLLFQLSSVNQAGRFLEIRGPFDGNGSNTDIRINGNPAAVVAESTRKVIAVNANLVGLLEVRIAESDKKVHCVYKNVDLRSWASASTLESGAKAALTIQLNSSPKLTLPVVIALQNNSPQVVNIEGGSFQYLTVSPGDLNEAGSVTISRTLMGMHPAPFKIDVRLDTTNLFSTCVPPD